MGKSRVHRERAGERAPNSAGDVWERHLEEVTLDQYL